MKPMDSRSIDSELLDRMTEVELHLKYQCFSPALELLRGIIASHPDYLPAKEALRELYRRRGGWLATSKGSLERVRLGNDSE